MEDRTCEHCGSLFQSYPSVIASGRGRFCSHSCKMLARWAQRTTPEATYRRIRVPDHPLADASGIVAEHRMVLYDAIGPGPHPCHWCGRALNWVIAKGGPTALLVDHLDESTRNNDRSNLVPSCNRCNIRRAGKARYQFVGDDELFVERAGVRRRAQMQECASCGSGFLAALSEIRSGKGRFCSRSCARRQPRRP